MSSRDSLDSSDSSTLYEEEVPRVEVTAVLDKINNLPKESRPSGDQVVIAIVHSENLNLLEKELERKYSGILNLFKSRVRGTCFEELDRTIKNSAKSGSKKRLVLLVTSFASEIEFNVPSRYRSLTIIRCRHRQAKSPYLAIDPESTYCRIPLPRWDVRKRELDHKLELQAGVCLTDQFPDLMNGKFSSEFEAAIKSQADLLQDKKISMDKRKKLVASILGGIVAGTTAFKVYTCLDITAKGVFLQCQGIKLGIAGLKTLELGKMTLAAGSMKSSFVASASVLAPPILIGAAAGLAVGALVYYVEWDSVIQWLKNLLTGFWKWLMQVFKNLRANVSSWFQEREHCKDSHRSRRSSHYAHRH